MIPCQRFDPRQPPPSTGFWTPSAWFLAEVNHVLTGLLIFPFILFAHWSPWVPAACIVVWATLKEFWLDLFALEHDSLSGSVQDFLAYFIGTAACWIATQRFFLGAAVFAVALIALTLWDIAEQHSSQPYD